MFEDYGKDLRCAEDRQSNETRPMATSFEWRSLVGSGSGTVEHHRSDFHVLHSCGDDGEAESNCEEAFGDLDDSA